MKKCTFQHAKISAISSVVPAEEIRLDNELEYFGGEIKKAQRMTKISGIDRRRVANPGVTPADLCQQAAERLIADLDLDKNSVDTLILVTQHPDNLLPATACILQNKLHLPVTCPAFDVNQGCAGYVYGLWIAFALVESRAASRVLLLAGDGMSHLTDVDNRILAPLFCDCGTATLVEYSDSACPSWFSLGADGSGAETLIVPAGGARLPIPYDSKLREAYYEHLRDPNGVPWRLSWTYMDGGAIFDFTLNTVPAHILDLLDFANKSVDEIDMFVPHQANKQIMTTIADKVGLPIEKTVMEPFSKYGNAAVASIPLALCDTVLNGSQSTLLSGYGVGLAWASAVLRLDHVHNIGVHDFVLPPDHPKPEDVLAFWQKKITGGSNQ